MSLRPCTRCARHVRNTESCCPFCATALELVSERAPIVLPRAGRAAIMAFGVLVTGADAGCDTAVMGGMDAAYGGPPFDAGPTPDASVVDAAEDLGGDGAAYGGAPADTGLDAQREADARLEADARVEDDAARFGAPDALYGGPPWDASRTDQDAGSLEDDAGGSVLLYGGPPGV